MADWYNNITYGNISQKYLKILKKECLADAVLPILDKKYGSELNFPKNNSETTKKELNELVEFLSAISEESNAEYLARYLKYDKGLLQTIISMFQSKGVDVSEIVKSLNNDIAPTIFKLKQKYQRPRPNQLAQYYKLKLFAFDTKTGHSPSYPSGHTLQAYVILNIIGSKHPESYDFCKQLIDDVANCRVYLGLHYESDNDASYLIGQEILKLKSITKKYKI
jgi:hypothetical protein